MHIITTLKKSSNLFFIFHIFSIGLYFLWLMLFYLNRDHTNLDALKQIGIDFSLHVHLAIANKKMPYHVPVFLLKAKIFKFDCPSIIRYVSSTDTLENFPFLTKCSFFLRETMLFCFVKRNIYQSNEENRKCRTVGLHNSEL